ncbi:CubicO group peptidase (beta-lactamase class C family) [Paenibacillus turicensis]|uniref:CubicO group peptidase (Beta-lactamase class C family) n=1 Tax=Paenibacillus turicensis TaxID=160487 RepID=A0ABS4FQ26_9BACL|nr:serine hydrolase [Paenibacillus turicensis]MBP1904683.1 CubicO group peptidase (beta-lactamase class C family) [Paenibacillus turicensis]
MKKLVILALSTILLTTSPLLAVGSESQIPVDLNKENVVKFSDNFFKQQEVKDQLAGAGVVIVKDNKIILNEGYGYADVENKTPFDAEKTIFRLASVSKFLTSIGVMQLAEKQQIDLDQDIGQYLPQLGIENTTGAPLTAKHLMTNTSGFDLGRSAVRGKTYTLEEYVKQTKPSVVLKPGEAYKYNNYGFALLGYLIEQRSGLSFEAYMLQHLFKPLGMEQSYVLMNEEVKTNLATPYDAMLNPLPQMPNIPDSLPEGGMFSTGNDVAQLLLAVLNGGELQGRPGSSILSKTSLQQMQKNSVSINPAIAGSGYGLEASYPHLYNGYNVVEKGGDLPGFHTSLWLMPEENVGIFIVLNRDQGNLRQLFLQQFMNRYFPAKDSQAPPSVITKPTKGVLLSYEGMYKDLRFPAWRYDIKANVEQGTLIVTSPLGKHVLTWADDHLFYDSNGTPAGFKGNKTGNMYFFYNKPGSWSQKMPTPILYDDVPTNYPYANYIYNLTQMGLFASDSSLFQPEKPMSRGDFIALLLRLTDFPLSVSPSSFEDTIGNRNEAAIQTAIEAGIVSGFSDGTFRPDEVLTREQAATILWKLVKYGLGATPVEAKLQGEVSPWANEAVQYVVGRKMYGPDVNETADGVDYLAKNYLLKQEAAVLIDLFSQNLYKR